MVPAARERSRPKAALNLIELSIFMGFSPCFARTELRWQGKKVPSAQAGQTQANAALAG